MNYIAYGFLILVYAAFSWVGKAPVEGLLAILTGAMAALGTHLANTSTAERATNAANTANPVPPQKVSTAPTIITKD